MTLRGLLKHLSEMRDWKTDVSKLKKDYIQTDKKIAKLEKQIKELEEGK